jgi:hypothetical protein
LYTDQPLDSEGVIQIRNVVLLKIYFDWGQNFQLEPFSYAREPHHCSVYCPTKLVGALRGHKEMCCSVFASFIAKTVSQLIN